MPPKNWERKQYSKKAAATQWLRRWLCCDTEEGNKKVKKNLQSVPGSKSLHVPGFPQRRF